MPRFVADDLYGLRVAALTAVSLAVLSDCSVCSQGTVSTADTVVPVLQAAARHVDTTVGRGGRYLNPIVLVEPPQDSPRSLERWEGAALSTLRSTLKATVGLSSPNEIFVSDSTYRMFIRFGRPTPVGDGSYDVTVGFVWSQGIQLRALTVRKVGEEWAVVNDRFVGGT